MMVRIFGPAVEDLTGGWRKLCTEELSNLYSSLNIITMIKSSSMQKKLKSAYRILILKGRDHLGDLRHQWRIILKWILKKYTEIWNGFLWLRMKTSGRQTLVNVRRNFWFHKRRGNS
jgi:hypothetical protein